jgi:hypothetical protein
MTRTDAARAYLATLVLNYEELEAERLKLLAAAERITEIQAEKQDLLVDAQAALDKYNALEGTSHTLAQARKWFQRPSAPTAIDPTPELP